MLKFFRTRTVGIGETSVLLGFLLLIGACMPDPLELKEVPEVEPEIVVASQIFSDQSVVVVLTRTFSRLKAAKDTPLEELLEQIAVNDAVVVISGPDGTDTLQQEEEGVYVSHEFYFQEGATYELQVESATLGEVSATSRVQPRLRMESLATDLYYVGEDDTLVVVNYNFKDPPGMDHYMLSVKKLEQEKLVEQVLNPGAYILLFQDTVAHAQLYQEEISFWPDDYAAGDTVAVSLANISPEYYQFMEMRTGKRLSFLEFLSEPANYPSNVTGGKGFFNLFIPDYRLLVLEAQQ